MVDDGLTDGGDGGHGDNGHHPPASPSTNYTHAPRLSGTPPNRAPCQRRERKNKTNKQKQNNFRCAEPAEARFGIAKHSAEGGGGGAGGMGRARGKGMNRDKGKARGKGT